MSLRALLSLTPSSGGVTSRGARVRVHVKDLYSIIVTEKRAECRDFYVRWFGFQVVFEASWFVYLAATGDRTFGLAFMAPDHPSQPPGPETFSGQGHVPHGPGRRRRGGVRAAEARRAADSRIHCTTSPGVSGASLCTILPEPGLTSSSRSIRRRVLGRVRGVNGRRGNQEAARDAADEGAKA